MTKIEENETACQLIKFKVNEKNKILIDDNTTLRESKPGFARQNKQREFVTVSHVNNETQIFDIVNLVAFVVNVLQIETVEKDERVIHLRKATLKDVTDDIPLTLFGSMVDVIEKKSTYMLTDLECQNRNLQDF